MNLTALLNNMVSLCRSPKITEILEAKCPIMVQTRWLSRIESIIFILSRKEKLLYYRNHCDELDLNTLQISKYSELFTEENFSFIEDLGSITFPFSVLIKIFESNKCRQFKAVPLFDHLQSFLTQLAQNERFVKYRDIFEEIFSQIDFRKRKSMHWELICAAYSLTFEGKIWLKKKIFEESPNLITLTDFEQEFNNELPDLLFNHKKMQGCQEADQDYFSETLAKSLDNEVFPRVVEKIEFAELPLNPRDRVPKTHDLGLFNNIKETLRETAKRIGEDDRFIAEEFETFIFSPSKEKDLGLTKIFPENYWKGFVLMPKKKALVNAAAAILTVPASEASVERYFSKQKLVLNYLRLKSKEDLLNAKFQLRD